MKNFENTKTNKTRGQIVVSDLRVVFSARFTVIEGEILGQKTTLFDEKTHNEKTQTQARG